MKKTEAFEEAHVMAARLSVLTGFPVLISAAPEIRTHESESFPDDPQRRVRVNPTEPGLLLEHDGSRYLDRVVVPVVYDGGRGSSRWHVRLAVAWADELATGRAHLSGYAFGRCFVNSPAKELRLRFAEIEGAMAALGAVDLTRAANALVASWRPGTHTSASQRNAWESELIRAVNG